ncbi:unnamed protein product [Arabidopsis halleri]
MNLKNGYNYLSYWDMSKKQKKKKKKKGNNIARASQRLSWPGRDNKS